VQHRSVHRAPEHPDRRPVTSVDRDLRPPRAKRRDLEIGVELREQPLGLAPHQVIGSRVLDARR
jgi:hypothetical protein